MSETLVKVEGVSKKFCRSLKRSLWYGMRDIGNELLGRRHGGNGILRPDEFWAVKDISFELKRGECLGLIGHNGAGKTTLLRMLNGLIKPDQGRIEMRGKVGALIALGAGFNPVLTARENVYVNASVLGLKKRQIDEKLEEIIDFAELGEFVDAPVQTYSSGMQVRLGFAVATALQPDVLLLDEVLAVGDTAFRAKCFQRIGKILESAGVIFVSHDSNQIIRVCDKVMVLDNSMEVYQGPVQMGLNIYHNKSKKAEIQTVISADFIVAKSLQILTDKIRWGCEAEIDLSVTAEQATNVGLFLVHMYRDGFFISHSVIDADGIIIEKGLNKFKITVFDNHMTSGDVGISVSIFSQDRKSTILHMINAASYEMIGDRGYGPTIIQKAKIEKIS